MPDNDEELETILEALEDTMLKLTALLARRAKGDKLSPEIVLEIDDLKGSANRLKEKLEKMES